MRCVLGLLLVALAPHVVAEERIALPLVFQAEALPTGSTSSDVAIVVRRVDVAAAAPAVLPPAPVPTLTEPPSAPKGEVPPVRMRLPPQVSQHFSTQISRPPVIADEASASSELLAWRDHLEGKQERRIDRGAEIGGLAAIGVRLGGRSQAGAIVDATPELLRSLDEWNDEGALVVSVVPGSPAEQAGLVAGDVIVQYGGIWIDSMNLLVRIASRAEVGREQDVWVLRGGEIERLWLTPADRRDLETR